MRWDPIFNLRKGDMKKFSKSHEWYEPINDHGIRIGITHHAAVELSDVVFVEFPDIGKKLSDRQSVCVLESVKAVADVYSLAGEVIAINEKLKTEPQLVNQDPQGSGWLVEVRLNDMNSLNNYMTEEDYLEFVNSSST
jgi:glycine cleavage system H protein